MVYRRGRALADREEGSRLNELLFLQKIHGHLGLLALALCLHPWFSLRKATRPGRAARIACYLATLAVVLVNVMGWVVYPDYRIEIKPVLYAADPLLGDLFEVKEHLAWYSLAFAAAGAAVTWFGRDVRDERFRSAIRLTYTFSAALVLVVAAIGVYLSSIRGFAYTL